MPGPYVQLAVLCEKVLHEQDGVLSLIRLVDTVTHSSVGPEAPEEMPPFTISLTAVLQLRAGDARGRYAVKLRPEGPGGVQHEAMEMPVNFTGGDGDHGENLIVGLNFQVDAEGLYWFDVLFVDREAGDEQPLTRMPLRVVYQPQRTTYS